MNKLKKLKNELSKTHLEIEKLKDKENEILVKIENEEVAQIKKLQKQNGVSHEELIQFLEHNG